MIAYNHFPEDDAIDAASYMINRRPMMACGAAKMQFHANAEQKSLYRRRREGSISDFTTRIESFVAIHCEAAWHGHSGVNA